MSIFCKLVHSLNALSPILVTPSCIITFSSVVLYENALAAISFTVLGITIVFKPSTPEKAPSPIFVTVSGTVTVPSSDINAKFFPDDISSPFIII